MEIIHAVIVGIFITWVAIRSLDSIIKEFLFFGIILGGVESWKYWLTPYLNFPELPIFMGQIAASILLSWLIYRILLLVAVQGKVKPLKRLLKIVFGRVERLKL